MDESFRQLQLVELEILRVIDAFCRERGIRYSLYAGTLLGAIRHHGFIPWDDDLDICMPRGDYEAFVHAWEKDGPEGYIIQNKENTPTFTQSFTKIRKDHTTFLQYEWERNRYHTGIFVDVFPADRIPSRKIARAVYWLRNMRYQLYTREFVPPEAGATIKLGSKLLLTASPQRRARVREKDLAYITSFSDRRDSVIFIETMRSMKDPMPDNLLDNFIEADFEDGKYYVFDKWDAYLKNKFGDYMTLPPENERSFKHHALVLDFEHNLDEI